MVENHSKLEAAFLAGRADATAERTGVVAEGMEDLLRMVLSDGDCMALAHLSKVLFHSATPGSTLRVTAPVAALPLIVGNGGSNGDHGRGR
jgi:hypothetical protein